MPLCTRVNSPFNGNLHWGVPWGQKETCTGICNGTAESQNTYPDLPKSSEVTPIMQSCKVQQTLTNDAVSWSLRRSSCCLSRAWLTSSAGHGVVAQSCCQQCDPLPLRLPKHLKSWGSSRGRRQRCSWGAEGDHCGMVTSRHSSHSPRQNLPKVSTSLFFFS